MSYDIITMEDCASNYGVFKITGSHGNIYTVALNGSEGPAHCDCKQFKYGGDCKHIREVWEKACLFNPQWKDGKESPELRPENYTYDSFSGNTCTCGGPLVYVKRAV